MALMAGEKKKVLYVEIPADLKDRLENLARLRARKITAEATIALRQYVEREEKREGIKPPPPAEED
jgi:predicted transcriptional regulator